MNNSSVAVKIALVSLVLTGIVSLFLYSQQLQARKVKIPQSKTSIKNFLLPDMWSLTNKDDTYLVRLVPNGDLFITNELKIYAYIRFIKEQGSRTALGSGLILSNMLPGDNHRWLRIFYYEPDKNWVIENMRGKEPGLYQTVLHDPDFDGRIGKFFVITISKDGKNVAVEIPDEAYVSQKYDESLYDITNNFFLGVHLSPHSSVEIPALNAIQLFGKL